MTDYLIRFIGLLAIFLMLAVPCRAGEYTSNIIASDMKNLKADYAGFYLETGNLARLAASVAAAGVMANTEVDREAAEYYDENINSSLTDSLSEGARLPGEVLVTVPILLGLRMLTPDTRTGLWARDSLRAFITGAPAGLLIQYSTGGARPREGAGSGWHPFKGNNGLSGHTFTGAVPFITAAMMTENKYSRWALYGASFLPGISRINDRQHFLSQVAAGWYLAYLSCSVIQDRYGKEPVTVYPSTNPGGGLMVFVTGRY